MTTLKAELRPDDGNRPDDARTRTGTFDALGHRFDVVCDDQRIVEIVEQAFAVLAVCDPPAGSYELQRDVDSILVRWRGTNIDAVGSAADALMSLRADIQQRAIAAADADLVLRGGCVEVAGRTVIVAGDAGCGVSTLLAALVAAGGHYLSDDAIPVDVQSGRVRPFRQPLLLDDRALDLLPEVSALRSGVHSASGRRLVAMRRGDAAGEPALREVSVVLFPERDESGIAILHPVERDEAVVRLAEHAYNFPGHEADAIEAIHWLVQDADVCSLIGGDPRTSAQAVMDAFAGAI